MRTRILTESVADTHSFVSGCHLREIPLTYDFRQANEWLHILIFIHMKKFFLLLTLLCLSLSARAHDAEVDGIFYNLDAANKTATVTFKGVYSFLYDDEYSGDVVIPETVTYDGITYFVTSVGDECFYGCSSLTAITIPNSVTSI